MRAAVFVEQDQPLVIEELDPVEPGPQDVVVNIAASGVCHSDLSVMNGGLPIPPPCILGHEGTGTIDWVGSEVTSLKPGDRVVATFVPACGKCWYCVHDESNLCVGTADTAMAPRATRGDGSVAGCERGECTSSANPPTCSPWRTFPSPCPARARWASTSPGRRSTSPTS